MPRWWLRWLPWAKYYFNTSFQTTLKATSFEVVYGRAPLPLILCSAWVAAVDRQLRDRDAFIQDIRERLLQGQVLMKKAHNEKHRPVEFTVGDWVWLASTIRRRCQFVTAPRASCRPSFMGPMK
jgi:hypothetical protein